jgi:integrase
MWGFGRAIALWGFNAVQQFGADIESDQFWSVLTAAVAVNLHSQPPASRHLCRRASTGWTSMQDLSRMLSHKSARVTEKYYAPWVPERQVQLEEKVTEALKKMGA